jgi:[ribosomal protein S18]-alanine N-acetyltransferase
MDIRKAEINDFHTIISWIRNEQECRLWAGTQVRFPLTIDNLLNDIQYSHGNSYCLIYENNILAFGQLLPKENEFLHIARIIVSPSYRGTGYGKLLCNKLLQITAQLGYQKNSLNVYRSNINAFTLYKNLGFKEVVEKSAHDLCHMIKT